MPNEPYDKITWKSPLLVDDAFWVTTAEYKTIVTSLDTWWIPRTKVNYSRFRDEACHCFLHFIRSSADTTNDTLNDWCSRSTSCVAEFLWTSWVIYLCAHMYPLVFLPLLGFLTSCLTVSPDSSHSNTLPHPGHHAPVMPMNVTEDTSAVDSIIGKATSSIADSRM